MLNSRNLLANFTSAAGMRIVVAVVSFLFFVLLARRWGSTDLGAFATLLAIFTVLQQAPLLGLHVPLIRDLARRPESLADIGPSVAVLAVSVASLVGLLTGLVGDAYYPANMRQSFWLVGASLVPGAFLFVGESVLVAQERLARVAALNIGESLARTCVWIVLVVLGYGLTALFVALACLRVLMLVAYFRPQGLRPLLHIERCRRSVIADMLALCPTFLGILLLAAGLNRLDFIMLSSLGTLEQVGLYSVPYKIYETTLMVPSVLSLTLFPAFATAFATSFRRFETLIRQFVRVCVTAGLPCAIALTFVAEPLVVLLFGATFRDTAMVLVILAVVPVLMSIDQALAMALLASGQEQLDLRVLACSCGCYAIALGVLIPSMGFIGAAIATASTATVQVAIRYHLVSTRLGMQNMTSLASRPILAGVFMATTVLAVRPLSLVIAIALGATVYAITLVLLRAVTRADVSVILGVLQRPGEMS